MGVRGLMTCPLFNLDIYIFIYLFVTKGDLNKSKSKSKWVPFPPQLPLEK